MKLTAPLRIGTRGSPLALVQANLVAGALRAIHGLEEGAVEIVAIRTSGDRIQDRPLAEVGGKALWTKELDRALLDGETDLSVHSMKDVESVRPGTLALAAMLPRADVRDRLVGAGDLASLPAGARVGTSSPRRAAQLLHLRPDLRIVPIRGNVAGRLAKLAAGDADATLLAAAGLDRLGHAEIGVAIAIDVMLPAASQGAVGVECRAGDTLIADLVGSLNHAATWACVTAERTLLMALGGNCRSPAAVLALMNGEAIDLRAEILTEDGGERVTGRTRLDPGDGYPPVLLATDLLERSSPRLRASFTG
ncbi:MAG TPA: hydroxymethylbilane synthase [Sphingomonadaceae bacterium]|nr:hydroxymethylbilane synthase [Sphingomonadaceae bacterium]